MPNIELLQKTLEHIKENQIAWDQKQWRTIPGMRYGKPEPMPTPCGTAMCFAGEAIQLTDPGQWVLQVDEVMEYSKTASTDELRRLEHLLTWVRATPAEIEAGHGVDIVHPITKETIRAVQVEDRALDLLDLTDARLFNGDNTLEDLESAVANLVEHGNLNEWVPSHYDDDDGDDEDGDW